MATQLLDRPLSDVDEIAEGVQASAAEPLDSARTPWDLRRIRRRLQRVLQDPRAMTMASVIAASLAVVVVVMWGRRPRPRSREDLLLERSRETFERAGEALEAMASKVSFLER